MNSLLQEMQGRSAESPHLRKLLGKEENGCVRDLVRFAVLAFALLGVCQVGLAQYQDRDPNKTHTTSPTAPPQEARIDINHGTVDELMKIPGMTRSWAGRIVRFRPYWTKHDLLDDGVVPSQVYDRIKDYVIARRYKQ
jgi:DNA uptake protein ComE-like DNA-binding protein